jgi:hypothetical protein
VDLTGVMSTRFMARLICGLTCRACSCALVFIRTVVSLWTLSTVVCACRSSRCSCFGGYSTIYRFCCCCCILGKLGGWAKTSGTSEGAAVSASARVAARIEKTIFELMTIRILHIYKRISGH